MTFFKEECLSFFFLFFLLLTNLIIETKNDHKFYVSTTSIVYKEQRQTFEITSQMFIDDMETQLRLYNKDIKTEVLAASIRSPLQVSQVASMGAHGATIPPKIIYQMINHPLTDAGLETFMNDWKKTGQKF